MRGARSPPYNTIKKEKISMKLCDYGCGKEAKYKLKNEKLCCSENFRSCSQMKENKKQTCIEKYGVGNPFQNKEIQEKMKQIFMEKYGVENPSQNKEIKDKMKQTNMEKYGVGYPLQNKEVQEKMKQTCMEKYGVEHHFKNKEVQEKRKQTFMEKYGVDHPFKNKEVQEKKKQTFIDKYGVENYNQSLEAKENLLKRHPFLCLIEEIKIEDNQFKVHCKNSNCINSKENGGWFTPTSLQVNNRTTSLESSAGCDGSFLYCSEHCKTTCDAFNVHGDPERDTQLPYTQEQYETFKLHVLTRDNYICQFCGEIATDVHHERPIKLEPFFSLDPCYGWSCCEKCHYKKGHKKGTECSTGNLAAVVCAPVKKKGIK
jgi:5-methylcytosine-specific restriction endonuclease McrA